VLAAVPGVLIAGGPAHAQQQGSPLGFLLGPSLIGNPFIGQALTATNGTWRSPFPSQTYTRWEWWHCPRGDTTLGCVGIPDANTTSYTLTAADRGSWIRAARYICYPLSRCNPRTDPDVELLVPSAAKGPVTVAPPPTPTPTPVPTVAATPVPAPAPPPVFEVVAPVPTAPVPTAGQVLHESASRKIMRPFPTVRMRGVLTRRGARVTVFTVRAPKGAKVTVRCKGHCPRKTWAPHARKKSLTRVRAFERTLRAGTVISVSVTRHGYVGKKTVFVIRQGKSPRRIDSCLAPGRKARRTKCPAG
jgi:hypothetical protein